MYSATAGADGGRGGGAGGRGRGIIDPMLEKNICNEALYVDSSLFHLHIDILVN